MLVADARMHVQTVISALADDGDLIFDQPLANADPVAEIAAELERLKPVQQPWGYASLFIDKFGVKWSVWYPSPPREK